MNRNMLTIAAFDSSGATGIAADLKTFHQWRVYGCAVVTGILCQNTSGAQALYNTPLEIVGQQFETITSDIEIHAAKIGALGSLHHVQLIASLLAAVPIHTIVFDPISRTKNGIPLMDDAAVAEARRLLLPLSDFVVPNMEEAAAMTGLEVKDLGGMKAAAKALVELGAKHAIVTGGALPGSRATDVIADAKSVTVVDAARISTHHTLGLKCVLTSAILCQVARGVRIEIALDAAKHYIMKAMTHPFIIGKGSEGPLNLAAPI